MKIPPFTLERQYSEIGHDIENAVLNVLQKGQYIGGYEIAKFEDSFASLIGVKDVISCNSGTDALVLALRAFDIGHGDEVITPSFSFFATAEAISLVGANPVFVDINPDTFLLNINQIESRINSRTKAIIPVHLFGNAVDMTKLKLIAKKHNLKIIEDCAQATGSMWGSNNVGSIGDIGCFSFFPTKNLGCAGDGGAVTTSDESLAQKIRELAVHGSPKRYSHNHIGYNTRLDVIQAAILNVKIKSIKKWIKARQKIADNYIQLIDKNALLSLPQTNSELSCNTWNQFVIKVQNENFSNTKNYFELFETDVIKNKTSRNFLKSELLKIGINSIIYYPIPIHAQLAYKDKIFDKDLLFNTEKVCTEVLSLPMFPEITFEEQLYISENLNLILKKYTQIAQISA